MNIIRLFLLFFCSAVSSVLTHITETDDGTCDGNQGFVIQVRNKEELEKQLRSIFSNILKENPNVDLTITTKLMVDQLTSRNDVTKPTTSTYSTKGISPHHSLSTDITSNSTMGTDVTSTRENMDTTQPNTTMLTKMPLTTEITTIPFHITSTVEITTEEIQTTPLPSNCEVTYNSTCFRIVVYQIENVTYNTAESICDQIEGKPGNIYDATHYKMLQESIRQKILGDWKLNGVYIWTGMRFENNQIKHRSEEEVHLISDIWRRGSPYSNVNLRNIVIYVDEDPNRDQGIYNTEPSWEVHGVICEIGNEI